MWLAFLGCAVTGFIFVAAPWAIVELYAHGPRGSAPGSPTLDVTGSLGTFFTALVAIVRLVLGRVGGRPDKSGPSRKDAAKTSGADRLGVTTVTDAVPLGLRQRIQHLLLPWLGSAIAAVLLVLAWLVAEVAGATRGVEGAQVAVLAGAVGYLVLARVLVDVNRTSLHSLYRDRLASAFAVRRRHDAVQPAGQARMSQLADVGRELVVCATANITASGEVPAGTNGVSFTFTPGDSGLERPLGQRDGSTALYRRVDTADYERVVGLHDLTLFDMVAISGAAVSPMMGKMTRPAERFLLAIANVRLGVWLPHPALMPHPSHDVPQSPADAVEERMLRRLRSGSAKRLSAVLAERLRLATCAKASLWERLANELRYRTHQPNVRLLLREALGRQSLQDSCLYVTDGGHFDNLGLVEALRRDPEEVFVFDASGDRTTSWSTLGQAIALARAELDIEIEIEPTDMVKDGLVVQPFVDGTFRRAGKPGPGRKIWFCKLGVWPTAPWDVRAYSARHSSFPTDSTLQQLYDGEEFEAYRALGFAATTAMLDAVTPRWFCRPTARSRPTCRRRPTPRRPEPVRSGRGDERRACPRTLRAVEQERRWRGPRHRKRQRSLAGLRVARRDPGLSDVRRDRRGARPACRVPGRLCHPVQHRPTAPSRVHLQEEPHLPGGLGRRGARREFPRHRRHGVGSPFR